MHETADHFLRTPRLGFRCWTEDDLLLALALWGDPAVTKFVGGPFSKSEVRAKLGRELESMKTHKVQYWPMFLLSSDDHVGCGGLRPYKLDQRIYELGIHLRPAFWGKASPKSRAQPSSASGSRQSAPRRSSRVTTPRTPPRASCWQDSASGSRTMSFMLRLA
jgi:hypothetical protein